MVQMFYSGITVFFAPILFNAISGFFSDAMVKAAQVCSTPTLPGHFAHQSENQSESETMPYAACRMQPALRVAEFRCLKLKDLRLKDLCFYEVLSIKR